MEQKPTKMTELEIKAVTGRFGEYLKNPSCDTKKRMKIVARNMAMLRRETGFSQKEICDIIGVAPQTYSGYENGKHEPTLETMVRLSKLYDVTIDYLVGANKDEKDVADYETYENEANNPTLEMLAEMMKDMRQEIEELKKNK